MDILNQFIKIDFGCLMKIILICNSFNIEPTQQGGNNIIVTDL